MPPFYYDVVGPPKKSPSYRIDPPPKKKRLSWPTIYRRAERIFAGKLPAGGDFSAGGQSYNGASAGPAPVIWSTLRQSEFEPCEQRRAPLTLDSIDCCCLPLHSVQARIITIGRLIPAESLITFVSVPLNSSTLRTLHARSYAFCMLQSAKSTQAFRP